MFSLILQISEIGWKRPGNLSKKMPGELKQKQ